MVEPLINLQKRVINSLMNRATEYERIGDLINAKKLLEEALKLDPNNDLIKQKLDAISLALLLSQADEYEQIGDLYNAERVLREVLNLDPENDLVRQRLEAINTAISEKRTTPLEDYENAIRQGNKLMLEGDPSGYLSASETAISNWERDIKEQMVFWRAQWLPIWFVLGASEDCAFNDPSRPAFVSLMEGIEKMVTALLPIVEPEDIVKMANVYLEKHGEQFQLRPRKDDPLLMQQQQGGDSDSNSNKTR